MNRFVSHKMQTASWKQNRFKECVHAQNKENEQSMYGPEWRPGPVQTLDVMFGLTFCSVFCCTSAALYDIIIIIYRFIVFLSQAAQ